MKRGCGHPIYRQMRRVWLNFCDGTGAGWFTAIHPGELDSIVCAKCHAWLPLGPANDVGCEVEIRAAEIAVNVGELTEWWMFVGNATHEELLGWRGAGGAVAGYLARVIATHGEES